MTVTPMELSDFLAEIDLLHLQDRLTSEDIDMSVLPLLDDDDLKELGLSLGQRKRLLKSLKTLGKSDDSGSAPETPRIHAVQLRRLSVLFCDMIGSTQLGEELGIDEMQTVLQQYHDIADRIAKRHGGHMAASQGDGLVILFGYPRVLDGFAERCILAARELQDTLSRKPVLLEGRDPIRIGTRIGIASGQAAVGHRRSEHSGEQMHLVGPVVNRAARLQTVAQPDAIAVDPKTRDLTQASVLYAAPDLHSLKGLADPVEVFHVLGLHEGTEPQAAPVTLVGREAELAMMSNLWDTAQQGHAATFTISGETGIGKTTLVQSFLAGHVAAPARVIRLLCTAMTAQSPLRPVANALARLTGTDDQRPTLADLLTPATPKMTALTAQFLDLAAAPTGDAAISANDREAILDLLTGWIVNGSGAPTCVVLENAQWADDSTRKLMRRAAMQAKAQTAPLLVLAITRDSTEDIWSDEDSHTTLSLPPLDRSEASDLLDQILKDEPVPQSVRSNILDHADGNPLMLETLGHAFARRLLPEIADTVEVPHTIYESVCKRLDTIRSGRDVIEALAVLGTPASRDLLAEVIQTEARHVDKAIEALDQADLIELRSSGDRDSISIRHKAYRDVIYEQIDGRARRQCHAAAYRALCDELDIRPEILASHAQAAQDWANASTHALNAGEAFLRRSALVEAGHFLEIAEAALNRLPASASTSRDRLRATTGLASVERSRFGIATDRSAELGQQAVELAREIGDSKTELLALNGLYSHALVRADYPRAQDYAQALVRTAELTQDKTFVMIGTRALGAVALHRGDQSTAMQHLDKALGQYDREEHLPLAYAHGYDHAEICASLLSMSLWISGDLLRARQMGSFAIDHSRNIDHAHSLSQAISFRVMWGALARHGAELTRIGAEGIEVAETHGIRVMRAAARLFPYATELCLQPSPPDRDQLAELRPRIAEFRAANPFNYGPLQATVLAEVYLRAGDIAAADAVLREATETAARTGETWTSSEVLRMQARVAVARGDERTGARLRQEALDAARRTQATTITLRITCDMAEAERSPATVGAVRDALADMVSRDQGWDIARVEAILQDSSDA